MNIQFITWPRSGRNVILDCIGNAGNNYHIKREYIVKDTDEYTIGAWHDLSGNLKINPAQNYVIMYRNPIRAITSQYTLISHPSKIHLGKERKTELDWYEFLRDPKWGLPSWIRWMDKWVAYGYKHKNCLLLKYETLIKFPSIYLYALSEFCQAN